MKVVAFTFLLTFLFLKFEKIHCTWMNSYIYYTMEPEMKEFLELNRQEFKKESNALAEEKGG